VEGPLAPPGMRSRARSCPAMDQLAGRLVRFLGGEALSFPLEQVALEDSRPFQRRVLLAEWAIPRGRVSTCGRLARRLGMPGAAQAVGGVLAGNSFPIIIPCHRAVRSDGALGGFQGGLAIKRALLEMEGVRFSCYGRVLGPLDDA